MKIKHIRYKAGILIGLLSLSTLSSCVNTRQGLGMGNTFTRQPEQLEQPLDTDDASDQQDEQPLAMDGLSDQQEEQAHNRDNLQRSRFRSIIPSVGLIVAEPLAAILRVGRQMNVEDLLSLAQAATLGSLLVGVPLGDYLSRMLLGYNGSDSNQWSQKLLPFDPGSQL